MLRRLLRHPVLTLAGNALTIWTIAVFLLTAGIVGGVLWAFSSFPLVFQVLTLAGALGLCVLVLVLTAPLVRPLLSGVQLTVRSSVIAAQLDREKEGDTVMGVKLTEKTDASFATVLVLNARESGGSRAVARRVVAQVEIFDHDGRRLFNYVGWDNCSERDFRPTREEHRVFVAGKWKGDEDFFAITGTPPERGVGSREMVGQTYDVTVTLRGENLRRPISVNFLLANRGVGEHLSLSKA
ncbi:MAG TPA: hypothetical protein VGC49_01170 [Solirubrobacterales bacterium]|jgi:hypothetical protein